MKTKPVSQLSKPESHDANNVMAHSSKNASKHEILLGTVPSPNGPYCTAMRIRQILTIFWKSDWFLDVLKIRTDAQHYGNCLDVNKQWFRVFSTVLSTPGSFSALRKTSEHWTASRTLKLSACWKQPCRSQKQY